MSLGDKEEMKKEETEGLGNLSRQQLRELEAKDKTTFQVILDWIIMILPMICGVAAILEYKLIPDEISNKKPETYVGALLVFSGCTDKEIEREFADDREAPIPVTASGCTLSLTRRI